jgi:hypothetical protein
MFVSNVLVLHRAVGWREPLWRYPTRPLPLLQHPELVQQPLVDTNRVTTPRWANDAGPMRSTKVEDQLFMIRSHGTSAPAPGMLRHTCTHGHPHGHP